MTSGQYIVIEGWPVEFIPPGTPLVEEALSESVERDVDGILTRMVERDRKIAATRPPKPANPLRIDRT